MKINTYASKTGKWIKRGAAIAVCAGLGGLLGSCGGSGVSSETGVSVGTLSLNPPTGTLYANTPFTFTIAGGRKPYSITTSEPTVLPVPTTLDGNTFTVVPNNPGVVDPGGDANTVPRRSVNITIRDNAGTQISSGASAYAVLQNFLTGYSVGISTIGACGSGTGTGGTTAVTQACVGSDSAISLSPTSAGLIQNRRSLRLTVRYGAFTFVDENSTTAPTPTALTITTDDTGQVNARLRPSLNVPTQYAGFRVTDVQSGIYRDVDFVITNPTPTGTITVLPSTVTISGPFSTTCGTGSVDIFVRGGIPPYTITTSFPDLTITPSVVTNNNGTFRITAGNPNFCLAPGTVIVRDSGGNTPATVTVTTSVGTGTPPQPLVVTPSGVCVQNGGSSTILIIGGNDNKVLSVSDPNLIAVSPSASTGTFTATISALGVAPATPAQLSVTVYDGGGTPQTVAVTRKTTCP